jgi:putative acetyltransferase
MLRSAPCDIRVADFAEPQTLELLALHLAGMRENSPPESVFALDLSGLRSPDVTVWTAWRGLRIAGIGALKALGDNTAEVKSMRTHPAHLRNGVAAQMLAHIIAVARMRGYTRLSLETGRGEAFEPALNLYRRRGFVEGEAFSGYPENKFSQFFHLKL